MEKGAAARKGIKLSWKLLIFLISLELIEFRMSLWLEPLRLRLQTAISAGGGGEGKISGGNVIATCRVYGASIVCSGSHFLEHRSPGFDCALSSRLSSALFSIN
jgi:hypothetical protein